MTKEEILEGNKLIAEFMGGIFKDTDSNNIGISWISIHMGNDDVNFQEEDYPEKPHDGSCWKFNELKYHTSWDWLMPCVEKINQLNILKMSSNLGSLKMKVKGSLYGIGVNNTIEDVWEIVVLFIKTYNEKLSE